MNKKQIVVATTNLGKLKEIQFIFPNFIITSFKDMAYYPEIVESGETFEENALIKAKTIAMHFHTLCIADDSGICIDAFNGFPGVRTARFLEGTDRDRNLAILEKMKGIPKEKRTVTFHTCIAIADPNLAISVEKTLQGYIASNPRGENGFGFDEIFELEDGRTLAELSLEEKNGISNRRKALEEIKKYIVQD